MIVSVSIKLYLFFVHATTAISDSPVHSQPGSSKANSTVKQGESQFLTLSKHNYHKRFIVLLFRYNLI